MDLSRGFAIGFALVVVGFVVILLGSQGPSSSSVGGVVFIGPVPIVFGSGPNSGLLALIAVAAGIGMILVICLSILLWRGKSIQRGDVVSACETDELLSKV